jgi:cytochrome o ubiquinol oxidase subunit 2
VRKQLGKNEVNKKLKIGFIAFLLLWFLGIMVWYLHTKNFAVLNPAGTIAAKERHLMGITLALGMMVLIPVFIMTFFIAYKYREDNQQAKYSPELTGNLGAELIWWAIPIAIIGVLSVITWNSSHALDPHQPLTASGNPLNIQVIAMDWKWLFIYPQQGIASVNYFQFPVNTPVTFSITSDAPMNSFWIPQLGGQIYAMPGMSTPLHLIATKAGNYDGSSANISGAGFAGMRFTAAASSSTQFADWVQTAKRDTRPLNMSTYNQLAKASQNNPVALYSSVDNSLYDRVLVKYMGDGGS